MDLRCRAEQFSASTVCALMAGCQASVCHVAIHLPVHEVFGVRHGDVAVGLQGRVRVHDEVRQEVVSHGLGLRRLWSKVGCRGLWVSMGKEVTGLGEQCIRNVFVVAPTTPSFSPWQLGTVQSGGRL
jgi:hypothetical protein